MKQILFLIFILIISFHLIGAVKFCSSVEIINEQDMQQLKYCTTVMGHVRIANLPLLNNHNMTSPLEEITDYLMVYRVEGLQSLENVFPNLTIIRGHELLFDKYSLVVYENRDLRNLGLKSLLKIRQGSIQIESNPVLCFADTVNWVYLIEDPLLQRYSLRNNMDLNNCALCPINDSNSEIDYLKTSCWNLDNFQRKKPIPHLKSCPEVCGLNGCTTEGKCCSPLCLTGCSPKNCRICKNFKNLQGNCVESCVVPFYTLADECITFKECHKRGRIPHAGACISECPKSYQQDVVDRVAICNLKCNRSFTIRSKDDLEDVKDCTIIRGSLHIELNDDKTYIIEELEKALGGIKQITGSLKITKSPQIVSLGFLKKLDTIDGDELIDQEIALYVVNNIHLEEIWAENHNVSILKGRIFFHLNPRLCFDKILQLIPSVRSLDALTVKDASHNSNGERVICGSRVHPLHPVVEDLNATAARIKVGTVPSADLEVVIGYLHYYKEAPVKNVTLYDGRHGCGYDNWQMDRSISRNIRHVITNLKPYTQYAYFVKTLTRDYPIKADWYSTIQYFRTSARKPGSVEKIYTTVLSANTIIVHWWPPKDPNGVIASYLLHYEPIDKQLNLSQVDGYSVQSKNRDCNCGVPHKIRGPPPNELNFYNREQCIMESAVMNWVYVSASAIRKAEQQQQQEDQTKRKRESPMSSDKSRNRLVAATDVTTEKIITAEEQKKIDDAIEFDKQMQEVENNATRIQDTGITDYKILREPPICTTTNPSKEYQEKYNCAAQESYEGTQILGTTHSYTLDNLESNGAYKIFIRACVEGLDNPCGPEISIQAETVSKSMEYFLKGP